MKKTNTNKSMNKEIMNKFGYNADLDRYLKKVFDETHKLSKTQFADETKLAQCQTLVYDRIPNQKHRRKGVAVDIISGGTVATGYKYADEYRTAILNFADAITPGGLVLIGGTTQEENICRCSNLYEALTLGFCMKDYYRANALTRGSVYLDKIIYSADVTVFRDDITYDMVTPKKMDVITCPAPSAFFKSDAVALNVYKNRIRNIVNSAILNEVDCLVLGAWGCGAFCQDPKLISKAFVDVLNEYAGGFKKIVFAFRNTPGTTKYTDTTAKVFIDEFNKNYKWGVNNGLR